MQGCRRRRRSCSQGHRQRCLESDGRARVFRSVRTAAVEFVATAAAALPPTDVYALLLPTLAPSLEREPFSLSSQQVLRVALMQIHLTTFWTCCSARNAGSQRRCSPIPAVAATRDTRRSCDSTAVRELLSCSGTGAGAVPCSARTGASAAGAAAAAAADDAASGARPHAAQPCQLPSGDAAQSPGHASFKWRPAAGAGGVCQLHSC